MAFEKLIKRWWKESTPTERFGFITITIAFCATSYNAFADVSELKKWQEQTIPSLAAMAQEIHDMHEMFCPFNTCRMPVNAR